ncbi:MAG: L,D-transpeptidase [Leptolyngbyaceae cyanobacterium CRU_2_3]|nr:L,D-transpeptidase [Leptolyngbyaceae cyanobacterium CRU_2_3]
MDFRPSWQACLGTSMFLLFVAVPSAVQASNHEDIANPGAKSSTVPISPLYPPNVPDLPPIQPVLPEALSTRLVLKLSERRVYVYQGNSLQATYPVAVGGVGWETPIGSFQVAAMLENPGWTNPFTGEVTPAGSASPLGDRWIEFWTDGTNAIGFHGTPDRDSVGEAVSHGCVRMLNEDIRQMYAIVQLGTPVNVEP